MVGNTDRLTSSAVSYVVLGRSGQWWLIRHACSFSSLQASCLQDRRHIWSRPPSSTRQTPQIAPPSCGLSRRRQRARRMPRASPAPLPAFTGATAGSAIADGPRAARILTDDQPDAAMSTHFVRVTGECNVCPGTCGSALVLLSLREREYRVNFVASQVCSPPGRYFRVLDAPAYCSDQARCVADEACYGPLLGRQLRGFANESVAVEAATRCATRGPVPPRTEYLGSSR